MTKLITTHRSYLLLIDNGTEIKGEVSHYSKNLGLISLEDSYKIIAHLPHNNIIPVLEGVLLLPALPNKDIYAPKRSATGKENKGKWVNKDSDKFFKSGESAPSYSTAKEFWNLNISKIFPLDFIPEYEYYNLPEERYSSIRKNKRLKIVNGILQGTYKY